MCATVIDNPSTEPSVGTSRLGRLTIALPFLALVLFVFDNQIARIFDLSRSGESLIPGLPLISDQYEFLLNCSGVPNIFDKLVCRKGMAESLKLYDFRIFEWCIWLSLTLCIFRVVIDSFALEKLDRYASKIRGKSITGFLAAFLFLGPVGLFASTSFELASHSNEARYMMLHAPRAFLCLQAFVFGVSSAFTAEGALFLAWIVIRRRRIATGTKGAIG